MRLLRFLTLLILLLLVIAGILHMSTMLTVSLNGLNPYGVIIAVILLAWLLIVGTGLIVKILKAIVTP